MKKSKEMEITSWLEDKDGKVTNLTKKGSLDLGTGKLKRNLIVKISSIETDDKKLLHTLLEKTRK